VVIRPDASHPTAIPTADLSAKLKYRPIPPVT
jgi:hypothetical protein